MVIRDEWFPVAGSNMLFQQKKKKRGGSGEQTLRQADGRSGDGSSRGRGRNGAAVAGFSVGVGEGQDGGQNQQGEQGADGGGCFHDVLIVIQVRPESTCCW
jgi:hypothetical protein